MSLLTKRVLAAPPIRALVRTEIPHAFVDFCAWLGVDLTPGQAELSRVAFDGVQPVDVALGARLFGQHVPVGRCRVVAAVCGRRAGKSYVLVALRLVHGMLVRRVPKLPPGQRAVALIIAPRDSLRMEVFRYAMGAVMSKPELAAMLVGRAKVDSFKLRRPDGVEVSFETGVATAGGTAARGRWFTDLALDECAFFRDDSFKVNDEELFRAGSATLLPGGQALVTSTPWAEGGLLYRLWKERPEGTVVAHAPTLVLNDSPETREAVTQAEAQDPENARREFGAEFMTSGTTVFFESSNLDAATVNEPFTLVGGDQVAAGGDLGFRGDSSALVLVARRGDVLHLFDGLECRSSAETPLSLEDTFAKFMTLMKSRKCGYLLADHHYRDAMAEALAKHDIAVAPAVGSTPADRYVRAREALRAGRVKIHGVEFRERLMRQLREVHGKPTSGGGMSIQHPRWATGGHGDLADAFVLALWQLGGDVVAAEKPDVGTPAHELLMQDNRRKALIAERSDQGWKARMGLR